MSRDPEDALQELAETAYGRGAAVSHERSPAGGWTSKAYGPKGEIVEIEHAATKPDARSKLGMALRKAAKPLTATLGEVARRARCDR